MELLKELFVSGLIAVFLSFFVAKLVSFIVSATASTSVLMNAAIASKADEMMRIGDLLHSLDSRPTEISCQQEATLAEAAAVKHMEVTPESSIEHSIPLETTIEGKQGKIEEDWEGIERSETEELFIKAACLVNSGKHDDLADESIQLELHALKKVATEGPCRELPPMPLKLTARAYWSAWHKLGNMSPEEAMEKYISIVSQRIPEWVNNNSTVVSGGFTPSDKDGGLMHN